MSILTATNLSLSFGAFDLFSGLTFSIARNSKIGLIGPNGIGKTSLLLILANLVEPTTGTVRLAYDCRLGYLRQEAVEAFASQSITVYAEMLSVFSDLLSKQEQLSALEERLASGEYSDELIETYGNLQEAFDREGGYEYELHIQQTLQGLGLGTSCWHTPLNHLSGGQKTRALLARLLLQKPDLLMLDEPTNHMDMDAVIWLENKLREWKGAIIVVSHDRYFLDNSVNTIWEMSRVGLDVYTGNYSAYLLQRQERWDYFERVFLEEKARLQKDVDFIQRNFARASTHARALGLLRRVSRDLTLIENYGILALRNGKKWSETGLSLERPLEVIEAVRRVNDLSMPQGRHKPIKPRLKEAKLSGNMIIRAKEVSIGYPGNHLFDIHELELRRGECAALLGPNGSGKTTLLKVLLGQLPPLSGEMNLGASLKIGYFAQAHSSLKGDHTVLEELLSHKSMHTGAARSYLARYLFSDDDVFKPVSALSGGERARLALALLALDEVNLLLLDEPTNHLDIPAREALQEVLNNFSGTILLVSHDRYLVDRLATQIWDIQKRKLNIFNGRYRDFILKGSAHSTAGKNGNKSKKAKQSDHHLLLSSRPMVRDNSKATRRREQNLALVEQRIREAENNLKQLATEMQRPENRKSFETINQLGWQAANYQTQLDNLLSEWDKLSTDSG
jgi:ATP-binding cassette, subfamily F, member 3